MDVQKTNTVKCDNFVFMGF